MVKTFNGLCLTLGELKEFVDKCYEKYPEDTRITMQDAAYHDLEINVRSALGDNDSICFYPTV